MSLLLLLLLSPSPVAVLSGSVVLFRGACETEHITVNTGTES
jgi:hypothetical protein